MQILTYNSLQSWIIIFVHWTLDLACHCRIKHLNYWTRCNDATIKYVLHLQACHNQTQRWIDLTIFRTRDNYAADCSTMAWLSAIFFVSESIQYFYRSFFVGKFVCIYFSIFPLVFVYFWLSFWLSLLFICIFLSFFVGKFSLVWWWINSEI